MRQYLDVKWRYPDALLFFRLGDFYEMFFEDAQLGAKRVEFRTRLDNGASLDDLLPDLAMRRRGVVHPHYVDQAEVEGAAELRKVVETKRFKSEKEWQTFRSQAIEAAGRSP